MKNITKITMAVLMLFVLAGTVSAGSINGADYYDGDWNLIWNNGQMREINDNDVDIDADTIEGNTASDLLSSAYSYADSHDKTGSSFKTDDMKNYIYGEEYLGYLNSRYIRVFDFAAEVFYNRAYMETLKYMIEHPNVEFHFEESVEIKQARYMAAYTNVSQQVGKTTCNPNGACFA